MALMVNGHYLAVLSVSVQDNQSESEAINKIKDIVKNMYAVVSPQTPLKIGRKPWDTNEQVWKFYAISKGNNLYSGLAKTLLIDKNIPKTKDLEKQFIPIQRALANNDRMNEYIKVVGSAAYACPPGLEPGQYWGHQLFS